MGTNNSDFYLPVYVINLKERTERRQHIEEQFQGRVEFALHWIEAIEHSIGAVGLWQSMLKAVQTAIDKRDDIMIICEDDHIFTPAYNKDYLFANIIGANAQGSDLAQRYQWTQIAIGWIGFGLRNLSLFLSRYFKRY